MTEISNASMVSDPMGWDLAPDDSTPLPVVTNDKQYNELRKKVGLAQDETLR